MHHQAVIYADAAGYPRRAARLASICAELGIPFVHVTPADVAVPGAVACELPEDWLPRIDLARPEANARGYREWFRCHLYAVLGARLLPPARHYWLIEGDVDGPSATFARLFDQTAELPEDGLWSRLIHHAEQPDHPAFAVHPKWCDTYSLGCLIRISAAGLAVWEATAHETCEIFTELAAPSTLTRAGLPVGRINRRPARSLYHTGTLRFNPGRTAVVPDYSDTLLRHPIKEDDD